MKTTVFRALLIAVAAAVSASAQASVVGWDGAAAGGALEQLGVPFTRRPRRVVPRTAPLPGKQDPVLAWNRAALDAIAAAGTPPPMAARNLAIVHAAIFDAVNLVTKRYAPWYVAPKASGSAAAALAADEAAHWVLTDLYPAQKARFDALYLSQAEGVASEERQAAGDVGIAAGAAALHARRGDGALGHHTYEPREGAGFWEPTPPKHAPALLPQWPGVKPFLMTSGAQFRPAAPPAADSPEFAAELEEVRRLGGRDSAARTQDQALIAAFWADGPGSVTPPGHWNVIARDISRARNTSMEENARLFAMLNFAVADAGIAAWDAKYAYHWWRPITAIRAKADPAWTPLLDTPPFPEHTSGHSTFSAAAATVIAGFYGTDAIGFTTSSAGQTRSYGGLRVAAEEAGLSRIYGGIHFRSGNRAGLETGRAIGRRAFEVFPRPAR